MKSKLNSENRIFFLLLLLSVFLFLSPLRIVLRLDYNGKTIKSYKVSATVVVVVVVHPKRKFILSYF